MADTKFVYSITPTPNPIRVSVHPEERKVDLLVMINNRGDQTALNTIKIKIPIGADDDYALSSADEFPSLTSDGNSQWKIVFEKTTNLIVITPWDETNNMLANTITFKLPGIIVNHIEGNVPITVSDISPSRFDNLTPLTKFPDSSPLIRYYAKLDGQELKLPVLSEADQDISIVWECTDDGVNSTYRLTQLINDNPFGAPEVHTAAEGRAGVTKTVPATSRFKLEVLAPGSIVTGAADLTVWLALPQFVSTKFYTAFGGRLVRLHWLALNAGRCEVKMINANNPSQVTVVDSNAPPDTYRKGYRWIPTSTDVGAAWSFQLTASAAIGEARDFYRDFPDAVVTDAVSVGVGFAAMNVAVTKRKALIGGYGDARLIDLASRQVETIPTGDSGLGVAVTPDGNLGITMNTAAVKVIDLQSKQIRHDIPIKGGSAYFQDVGNGSSPIYVLPDSKRAVVAASLNEVIVFDDIGAGHIASHISLPSQKPDFLADDEWFPTGRSIVATPDGNFAYVALNASAWYTTRLGPEYSAQIRLVDVAQQTSTVIAEGAFFNDVAITPDGTLVLAVDRIRYQVMVIDTARRQVVRTINVDPYPHGICITPDGKLALIAINEDYDNISRTTGEARENYVAVIDIATGAVVTRLFAGAQPGTAPCDVAITPDGLQAVITNYKDQNVRIL